MNDTKDRSSCSRLFRYIHCINYPKIFWCENVEETHTFRRISGKSPETLRKNFAFPQNFRIRKLGEISVFYAVVFFTNNFEKFPV